MPPKKNLSPRPPAEPRSQTGRARTGNTSAASSSEAAVGRRATTLRREVATAQTVNERAAPEIVNDSVTKIQAAVRGSLTRRSLEEASQAAAELKAKEKTKRKDFYWFNVSEMSEHVYEEMGRPAEGEPVPQPQQHILVRKGAWASAR